MNAIDWFSPAQMVGYVALVLGVSAFLQKSDKRLKTLISCESLAYVVHFVLLANFTAAGSALVACLRTWASIKSRSPVLAAIFFCLSFAVGVFFAKSAVGWIPVVASCLATLAVFLMQGVPMRLVLLVCTLLWLANNLLSASIGGTVLEAMIASVNVTTIIRLTLERRAERCRCGASPSC
jgi:hypothetical protein